jgi:hypothetical protein
MQQRLTKQTIQDSNESKTKQSKSPSYGLKSPSECLYCKKPHTLEKCFKFKGLQMKDRIEFGKKEKMCFNCLKIGHLSSNCKAFPNCVLSGCKLKHHSPFHNCYDANSGSASSEAVPSSSTSALPSSSSGASAPNGAGMKMQSTHILLNPSPISLGILPVRTNAEGGKKSVEGYAFIDNGSTGTIVLG